MADSTPTQLEKIAFVMKVLKTMELPKADWPSVAAEDGIQNPENARKKFKRIIQEAGFVLDGDQIVDAEGAGNAAEAGVAVTPNPKKRKASGKKAAKGAATDKAANSEGSSKKAKLDESAATDEGDKVEVVVEPSASLRPLLPEPSGSQEA
ncbi:hypothetical protein H2200_009377 [Cladophialophora chaetospira]|uniref:Myb-like DNA-binding domain-containing protein n=1 Tax=Cladophialophora chaetospira TaxID=386627 RepID=A0AA39CFI0_9EURO|nr:hypothetical protein H2200_009377 [Cladophialophora chaetospira]